MAKKKLILLSYYRGSAIAYPKSLLKKNTKRQFTLPPITVSLGSEKSDQTTKGQYNES